ncbi:YihY/virulence factor BrkB family protein [Frankia sp. AgB1.9]|uniref:YihY/virulence factor BrkB family protein n=1 Tax=unclassified Frankia TaxID=2632575 RepID=UPI0019349783|nr:MULTISPECIES: YihY/virulence factor BrkB family protein [unclassified Frankia]MBL7493434.1 YihY/virulence factor BrkB family protein [Frankia sp. AgW1.1]MBL7551468.1 YihY/virulence factor BrkB family protein [Frankia sp. AgB1.9]MBL7624780.1 YihY/virulence factor BrkB family protein [Frankia sp. AgB1.8]
MDGIRGTFDTARRGVSGGVSTTRRSLPPLDHTIRAYARYGANGGDRLAASTTYYVFLSFFPLVALLFAATGFVVDSYPDLKDDVVRQINGYLPGLADKLNISSLGTLKVGIGVLGLVGLLLAGLAFVSALRDAIRLMWHQDTDAGNLITRRLRDIRVLAGLGLLVVISLALTSLATSANGVLLRATGMAGSSLASWSARGLGVLLALIADLMVFLYLFWRLPRQTSRRAVARAALLGAVGIEVFKLVGTWLVGKTTDNPMYGTFAVLVGLLIWINVVMRWTLFAAAWAVTAPGNSDVFPSGTADQQTSEADATTDEPAPEGPAPEADPAREVPASGAAGAADEASPASPPAPADAGEPSPDRHWLADRFRGVVLRRHPAAPRDPTNTRHPATLPGPATGPAPAARPAPEPPSARTAPRDEATPAARAPARGEDGRSSS